MLVRLGGELDLSNISLLAEKLGDIIPTRDIIVDLSGLQYIDSTAIATLAQLHDRAIRLGRRFILAQPSLFVERILDLTSLRHVVTVYPEVAVALDALRETTAVGRAPIQLEPVTVEEFVRDMTDVVRGLQAWAERAQSSAMLTRLTDVLVERLLQRADQGTTVYVTEAQFYDILFGADIPAALGGRESVHHAAAAVRSLFDAVIAPALAQRVAEMRHPRVRVTKHVWIRAGHWDVEVLARRD
jgi:anti-sigma B factor antagonist